MLQQVRHIILGIIDFFHRPFRRWINERTFRYLACGGSNQLFYIFLYFISYNYILHQKGIPIYGKFQITAPIAAYLMAFSVSFPMGFILSRHIVFPESDLRGRIQFFRYVVLTLICIVLTYVLLKFFDQVCGFYPTPSAALTSVLIAIFSYMTQSNYTFKVAGNEADEALIEKEKKVVVHD